MKKNLKKFLNLKKKIQKNLELKKKIQKNLEFEMEKNLEKFKKLNILPIESFDLIFSH